MRVAACAVAGVAAVRLALVDQLGPIGAQTAVRMPVANLCLREQRTVAVTDASTAPELDDESLRAAVDEAVEGATKARDNPNLPPLVKPPQTYVPVEANTNLIFNELGVYLGGDVQVTDYAMSGSPDLAEQATKAAIENGVRKVDGDNACGNGWFWVTELFYG